MVNKESILTHVSNMLDEMIEHGSENEVAGTLDVRLSTYNTDTELFTDYTIELVERADGTWVAVDATDITTRAG
jgi:hypothetical protein